MDSEWAKLAERVGARHRSRDSLVRGVGVVGDYARNQVWDGSLLQIVLFRHRDQALIEEGGIAEENGVRVVVDSITSGALVELEELLHVEPLAGNLADMHTLRMADPTLRDVLARLRDRYYSAAGRQQRAAHALQRARVALDDYEATQLPVHAVESVRTCLFQAVSAFVGEPLDFLRLPRRMRAGGRLLKMLDLWSQVSEALRLSDDADVLQERWSAVDGLYSLCRAHLDARMPEVGAALVPRLERGIAPARSGSEALSGAGDLTGAHWTALAAAAEIDGIVEAASPGWRERTDYRERSLAVYGAPDAEALRRVSVDLQRRLA
ncbi:MAG: hypothetical protein F4102_09590 [Chloroflexi bacterium]|nr:hypothetical protein [Chloroflexota bacterium]